jgi:hypothetical protein
LSSGQRDLIALSPENVRRGWHPDIFGIHEFRFYSDDGKPTLLVRDGGRQSHDPPPPPETVHSSSIAQSTPEDAPSVSASRFEPHQEPGFRVTDSQPAASRASALYEVAIAQYERSTQSLGTPTKVAYGLILAVMVVSGIAIAVDHLSGKSSHIPSSTDPSTSVVNSATSTTVQDTPVDLSPSAASSAAALVSSWAAGDRTTALTVATQNAVTTIFSVPYPTGLAIDRGCSVAFSPIVCTYGPPGGASPSDRIFEIDVSQAPHGWYVSAVRIEN